jgi:ABC-type lipoprotein export system ATPase subunit
MLLNRERLNRTLGISMAQKKNSTLEMKPACRSDTLVTPRVHDVNSQKTAEARLRELSNVFQQFHVFKKMRVQASILCADLPQQYLPHLL